MMQAHTETARAATLRMGIDVGGTAMKWVVLRGEDVLRSGTRPTPRDNADAVLAAVVELAGQEAGLEAVGIALPAVVDFEHGATLVVPNLPGDWIRRPVVGPLRTALGVPVAVANDARALTLAEWRLGAARGYTDAIVLALGTGVGGGIVSDARVVRGPRGRAGEIGHMPVEAGGERCGCGATGCLETVAGGRALVRGGEAAVRRGEAPKLASAGAVTPETVADAARRGDPGAQGVLDRAGTGIGRALASLAVALTPQVFVIGGGLAPALELMRPAIDAQLDERAPLFGTIPVVRSTLGLHAGAIGAALWKDDQ